MTAGKARDLSRRSRFKYVRMVRNQRGLRYWQARGWLPLPVGSVHLGCYHHERAAWDAVKGWLRSGGDPVKGLPKDVLPKWVVARGDGMFDAILRSADGLRSLLPGGPWPTAEAAHLAARATMERRAKLKVGAAAREKERVNRWFQQTLFEQWEC